MAPSAYAATATGNLAVNATVVDTCFVAATAMSFVNIDGSAVTDETTPSTVTVTCTANQTGVDVSLGGGNNEDTGQRRMIGALTSTYLPYNVFSDAGHSSAVAVGGSVYSGNITGAVPVEIYVYGQIPAGAYATDNYSDSILITVTYP